MNNRNVILRIVVLALLLYSMANFTAAQERLRETEQTADRLRQELNELQNEHEELEAALLNLEDEDELRRLARQRLGMVMPGEKIFYFTTDREEALWGWK